MAAAETGFLVVLVSWEHNNKHAYTSTKPWCDIFVTWRAVMSDYVLQWQHQHSPKRRQMGINASTSF